MFATKEIVLSVENKLILADLFEWKAISVWFLQTFNQNLENNVRPYAVQQICPQTVRTFENTKKIWRYELLAMTFREHFWTLLLFIKKR